MNLGQLRTAVGRKTGIAVDTTAMTEFVNEAVQAIGEERDWPWQDALDDFNTDGSAAYTLPYDWARTRTVSIDNYPVERINVLDGDTFDRYYRGGIYSYAIEGDEIIFYPTPTSGLAVKHRYVAVEQPLVSDSDEPLIPTRFHQAIVNYASAIVHDRSGDDKRAASARLEYERWFRRMLDSLIRNQGPTRIRATRSIGF